MKGTRWRAVHHDGIREAFDGYVLRPSDPVHLIAASNVASERILAVRTWSLSARTTTRADLATREAEGEAFTMAFPANDLQAIAADIVEKFVYNAKRTGRCIWLHLDAIRAETIASIRDPPLSQKSRDTSAADN